MTTQNVKVDSASNLFSGSSSQANQKSKQVTNSFDLFMGKNLSAVQTAQTTHPVAENKSGSKVQKANDKVSNSNDKTNSTQSYATKSKDEAQADSKTTVTSKDNQKTADTSNVTDTNKTAGTQTDNQTTEDELLTKITSMVNAIQEMLMKLLNLTPEELNKLMSDQNMSSSDLLQADNLMKLILANNGSTDISAVLTDENLANTIKQMLSSLDQIKTETGLSVTDDQLQEVLQQMKAYESDDTATAPQVIQSDIVEVAVNENKTTQSSQTDSQTVKEQDGLAKEITVQVTKTTDTDSNTGAGADTGNRNSMESDASQESYQLFLDNLVKASQNTENNMTGSNVTFSNLREIANQIIDRIKVVIKPNQTSMELQLNPEHLGKVNLNVQSKNGVMTAQFVVQSEITKEAIESQLNTLKETLNQQGIKIDAIEVTVANYNFSQNSQTDTGDQMKEQSNQAKKKITIDESQVINEETEEESTSADLTGLTGNSIDYTA